MIEKAVPRTDHLQLDFLKENNLSADVLRLDLVHPLVSGNKWYKLKYYLAEARAKGATAILTFGGAFSNHILATAAACAETGFTAIGIIRGEEPENPSATLLHAARLGMRLLYISREEYKVKKIPVPVLQQFPASYIIEEGGYGASGMAGAGEMLHGSFADNYTHILCAVGTGTTLAGLTVASQEYQQVIGISVLKNNFDLTKAINELLPEPRKDKFTLLHQYAFGGYARHTEELFRFMNDWYRQTGIPSDFVYTGKLFYAFSDLCRQDFFPSGAHMLLVHSGGLQGNSSLRKGTLIF